MSIEPAVHIDPKGHDVYSGSLDALRLVSVPLDVNKSLQTLHQALDLKHHTARSLEHSRQLLLCYLAGQQEGEGAGQHYGSLVTVMSFQRRYKLVVLTDAFDCLFKCFVFRRKNFNPLKQKSRNENRNKNTVDFFGDYNLS